MGTYSGVPANDIKTLLEASTRAEPTESREGYLKINRKLVLKGIPEHVEFRRRERENDGAKRGSTRMKLHLATNKD
jgi:hypothetical protein